MDGRSFIIPPSVRNTIMGIDRYVSSDFVNNGKVAVADRLVNYTVLTSL